MAASSNHFYGHNAVLARYVGLDHPRPILGYMLHGWHAWFPWMPDTAVVINAVPRGFPVLAWSHRDREVLTAAGVSNVIPIGSPFLYLLRKRGLPPRPEGSSLVSFPFHSLETCSIEDTWSEYADYLLSLQGYERITVCLHEVEYDLPGVREWFEGRGIETTTNGSRWDPRYLDRFYDLVASHTAVTSNRISTAVIYGAAMGRATFLGGPVPGVVDQQEIGQLEDEGRRTEEFQRSEFPELIEGLEPDAARELGWRQLGADCILEPRELGRTLGWFGPRRIWARTAAAMTSARRTMRARAGRPGGQRPEVGAQ